MGLTKNQLAMQVHEVGRSVYGGFNLVPLKQWEEMTEDERAMESAIVAQACGNKKLNGSEFHKLWRQTLSDLGWVIGPAPDAETKQHPGLVDYDKLAVHEKVRCMVQAHLIRVSAGIVTDADEEPKQARGKKEAEKPATV